MSTIPKTTTDIRNIRPNGKAPDKIYRIIDGEAVEIKKAYRIINDEAVVVWDVGNVPPTPVVTGMRTVWKVENVTHTLIFPAVTGIGVDGMIDWGDGNVQQCNSGIAIGHDYAEDGEYTVTVDYPITELINNAFKEADSTDKRDYTLLECYMSDDITKIGDYCFEYCINLKNVVLPDGVKTIGRGAFHYTSSLDTVEIPNSVTSIGYACWWYSAITHISIPNNFTTITNWFDLCYNLADVTLPNTVTSLTYGTFNGCTALKIIDIPSSMRTMDSSTFANCTDITIRIHKPQNSIGGSPWRATRANVIWLG